MTDHGYLVLRDALPEFHNMVTHTERCVQRTLLFRLYFLRILLFAGHGGDPMTLDQHKEFFWVAGTGFFQGSEGAVLGSKT